MAPIHPTAPTSSFSSSYCWYSPQVLARGVHASDARVCYSWRQQSLDLEKRGPVRPRASVALTHLSQDQKSVRRGSKEGRLEDVLVSSWNLSFGDLWNLLHSYSSSPMSQFFFLPLMRNFLLRCSDIPKGFLQTISSLNY